MPTESNHLADIMDKHNRVANLQVAFVDIEKYSKRRSLTQIQVIDAFTDCLRNALRATSQQYIDYAQENDVNFQNDVIILPTGDGAAAVFSFEGVHDIHLSFAKALLGEAHKLRQESPCETFDQQGWCNCHSNFNIRIGISEGKGIVYHDVNGNYNVAGRVINMASRVMGLFDSNQIGFTEEAYRQIIDMVTDPYFIEHFAEFPKARVKHGLELDVYQFVDSSCEYLNSDPPSELVLDSRMRSIAERMEELMFGSDSVFLKRLEGADREARIEVMEKMAELMTQLREAFAASPPALDAGRVIDAGEE